MFRTCFVALIMSLVVSACKTAPKRDQTGLKDTQETSPSFVSKKSWTSAELQQHEDHVASKLRDGVYVLDFTPSDESLGYWAGNTQFPGDSRTCAQRVALVGTPAGEELSAHYAKVLNFKSCKLASYHSVSRFGKCLDRVECKDPYPFNSKEKYYFVSSLMDFDFSPGDQEGGSNIDCIHNVMNRGLQFDGRGVFIPEFNDDYSLNGLQVIEFSGKGFFGGGSVMGCRILLEIKAP